MCLVPTNLYGPHDNFSLANGHVLPALLHRCLLAKRDGSPLVVAGSGTPRRQFVFAPDLARLLLWALRSYSSEVPLIIAPPAEDEVTIAQLASLAAGATRFGGAIEWDRSRADGQEAKTVSSARLRSLLPHFTFTPLDVGLKATAEWLESAFPNVRM